MADRAARSVDHLLRGLSQRVRIQALLVFTASLLVFTLGLAGEPFVAFQTRFALFAKHMLETGPTWFPVTYDRFYPDYPVTPTLLVHLAGKLTRHLDRLTVVLPTAVAAALSVSFTFLIAARLDRRWALASVLFCLLCLTFVAEARTVSMDHFTTAVTALAFYLACASDGARSAKLLAAYALAFAIGLACRGPIGAIVPTAVICMFFLARGDLRGFLVVGMVGTAVLVAGSLALLGAAYHVGGIDFAERVIDMQVVQRVARADKPFYYYFTRGIGHYALTFPVALLVMAVLWLPGAQRGARPALLRLAPSHRTLILAIMGWALIVIVGLSVASTKKSHYILPAVPALSLLAGYALLVPATLSAPARWLHRGLPWLLLSVPVLLLIAAVAARQIAAQRLPGLDIAWGSNFAVIATVAVVGGVALFRTRGAARLLAALTAATLSFLVVLTQIVEPGHDQRYGIVAFVERTEAYRGEHGRDLVFYDEHPDAQPLDYLANVAGLARATFVRGPRQLQRLAAGSVIVTDRENYAALPERIKRMTRVIHRSAAVAGFRPVALEMLPWENRTTD